MSKINYEELYIWHDREVRFDVPKNQLALRIGEKALDMIPNIEDSKGNNGDVGTLMFTNLRLIWYCQENIKINLSLGYDCVITSDIKTTTSKVAGETKGIYIKCKFNNNRFEFVFNALTNTPQMFTSFQAIYRAYDSSRLYRDMKIKGFLTQDKNLMTLPQEKIINRLITVASVNNDQAVNGTYYITNVRLVWYSNSVDNFNVSIPWIQIKSTKTKDSKVGKLISIETSKQAGGAIHNFRFSENLDNSLKEIQTTHKTYLEHPILGVDLENVNNQTKSPTSSTTQGSVSQSVNNIQTSKNISQNPDITFSNEETNIKTNEYNKMVNTANIDDVEIVDTNYFNEQPSMLYYMISNQEKKNAITDIVFSNELGLAVERLPENITLESLWKIIAN
jgi:Bardet-Biedl syndrome 5 protein